MSVTERFYRFADITFRIMGEEELMFREDGILAPFRTEGPACDHCIRYDVVDSLPAVKESCVFRGPRLQVFRDGNMQLSCMGDTALLPEGAYTQIRRRGEHTHVQILRREVPDRIGQRLVLNTLEMEHHTARHGGFLLHASYIRWEDRAILFTAPSGTGKSTQAELWRKYRGAEVINGDRAVLIPGETGVLAHGIPYCGTSGISGSAILPVAAIVYLSQAPRSELQQLTGLRAFRRVWEGCSVNVWDKDDVDLCIRAVTEAVEKVPVVHLACTPDENAVQVLETYLKERT